MTLGSHTKELPIDPHCPFPVGVEYYRPPVPPEEFWDQDLTRISASGMRIIRLFVSWNWIWTEPDQFEFDDLDRLFDLAANHDLQIWLETPLGTHMACPDWMIREHPDLRAERQDGSIQHPVAGQWAPQGAMIHNFDHPKWREYAEQYIHQIVLRYKDHPAMHIWGTWDGINLAAAWSGGSGYPPYNDYTIEKYRDWLKQRYTLEEVNALLLRRFRSWQEVNPPRSNDAIAEMILYRRFHYENMSDHLGWLADLIDRLDGKHEQRSHGASYPRQWDEVVSPSIDSWGLSMHSANRLTSSDPYSVAIECFGFQWSRAIGRKGRWWNEEIYSSFVGGLAPSEKKTTPEESVLYLWLSLIEGASGALYWQYRPEYMTFESPGLNLVGFDGEPTERWTAIEKAIQQIDSIAEHLPLTIPPSELAIAYSAPSHEVFWFGNREVSFIDAQRGVYRTLWSSNIPQDLVTPSMNWSEYKTVYLPNFAVLDETAISRLRQCLTNQAGPRLIADGHFGTFAGQGHWSFCPPEGLTDLIGARIVDFDWINESDIGEGRNLLQTEYGQYPITSPCQYAILEPKSGHRDVRPIATLEGDVVGLRSEKFKWAWFGVSLSQTSSSPTPGQPVSGRTSAGVVHPNLALSLFNSVGISQPFVLEGDRLIVFRRGSRRGGSLIFLLNLEKSTARTRVQPRWKIRTATDLLNHRELEVQWGGFSVQMGFAEVSVIYCDT